MATIWALPTVISQYAESEAEDAHISWQEVDNFSSLKNLDGKSIRTSRDLLHIARDPKRDITEKTYFLKVTGFQFNFIPTIIRGIEMKLSSNRFGRITDDTVQLVLNNNPIGLNQANLNLDPIKIYGNESDLWSSNLTSANINSSFGVIVRFQSHPKWPHKNSMLIDAIEIRLH